ncbi:MAG: hypothetical protein FJ138_11555 [Deltaproteobacteria bacterium]|nr:hypothetical protein [Deltaproteobacteria bacterium]
MRVECPRCHNHFQVSHKPFNSILGSANCFRCGHSFTPWFNQDREFWFFPSGQRRESPSEFRRRHEQKRRGKKR